jgi:hypothetical protein
MSDHGHAGFSSLSPTVNPAISSLLPSIATSIPSPPSRSPFPLPLLLYPVRPASTSRRVQQIHARECRVVSLANECVRALNTLHFNYPSARFVRQQLRLRSTVPSRAQRRIHDCLLSAAATYFHSCRRLYKQSSTGHPATTRTAPRAGSLLSASHSMGADVSSSLVIMPPRPLPAVASASRTGSAISSHAPEATFDLSVALRAFDAARGTTPASVSLPSSYDSTTGVLPIVAHRVALPDNLQHVSILSLLPVSAAAHYSRPSALLLPPEVVAERIRVARLRKPRVLATRNEYVKLVHRMLRLGMLQLTSSPHCVNSLFGVPKGDDIRLILDARLANCYFVDSPHVRLPSPSHLAQLQAEGPFAVAKCDLSNFYHQLELPQWIRPYFALPSLSLREQASLATCADLPLSVRTELAASKGSRLFPCCVTLPMGFSHSVFLAQCVHEHVLYSYSCLSPRDNLLNLLSPRIDRPLHALYVDDCVLVGPCIADVRQQYSSVLAAYDRALLPVKQSKCTEATTAAVAVLGVEICGAQRTITLSVERHSRILRATVALLCQPLVSARELARVLGAWTWELLLRRPVLAALKHCYRFVNRYLHSPPRPLWPSVVRELSVLSALSPLLSVDLQAPWADHLIATDSSSRAGGVVSTALRPDLLHTLWPLSALHLRSLLQQTQCPPPLSDPALPALSQPAVTASPPPATVSEVQQPVRAARWSTLISHEWEKEEHINALELEAMQLGLQWHASRSSSAGVRLPVLLDSSTAYYITRKGRSASPFLLTSFRRTAALTLALSATLVPMWLPSHLNPADAPSRSLQALASGCHQLARAP